jgi:hypothetical protein
MNRSRILYHMVRADFLERVRRYSFLLTMSFAIYLGYAVYARQVTLRLDDYRGVDNSAWLGTVIGLIATVWVSLIGFYIVKNSIQRDRQTRVGQILAATPMNKSFYTLGKTLSNFAVLAVMVLILALAAVFIQILRGEDTQIALGALLSPILLLGLPAVAVVAALAVLFESLPVLRGGVGNVFYFFFWTGLISISVTLVTGTQQPTGLHALQDFTGIAVVMGQMQTQLHLLDPQVSNAASFGFGNFHATTKTFLWTGIHWTPALLFGRALWLAVAGALALLAAVFFDRFDPARNGLRLGRKQKEAGNTDVLDARFSVVVPALPSVSHLTPLLRDASNRQTRTRFFSLIVAEFRLLFRGHGWWWYAAAAGLFLGCLLSPIDAARSGVLVAAWIWPVLFWSQMGTREESFSTGSLIFSAPRAVPRQLLAMYAAGALLAALTGGGLALRLLFAGNLSALAAWGAGVLFIPAMALALGVTTGSRKPFEALYTAWWYVGPLHHIRQLDFMGTTAQSSTPVGYFAVAALLVLAAYTWRSLRRAYA